MPRPVLLLTRPQEASEAFVASLGADIPAEIVISPLIEILPVGPLPQLDGIPSVIVTSGYAVKRMGSALEGVRVYTVGERTAELARQAGAKAVCLGSTVAELRRRLAEVEMPSLYLHGRHVSFDLVAAASAEGFEVSGSVIYDQVARAPSRETRELIQGGARVVVPVFSRRSAELLLQAIGDTTANPRFVAISRGVASVLESHGDVSIADTPDADSMKKAVLAAIRGAGLAGNAGALRL